jgi:hypothetical protein
MPLCRASTEANRKSIAAKRVSITPKALIDRTEPSIYRSKAGFIMLRHLAQHIEPS